MINSITNAVRRMMLPVAKWLNSITRGKLTPNGVTAISLLGHFFVAIAIINRDFTLAGILLIIFGLMDALDGALARVQKNASTFGMFADAVADRTKEIIIYCALTYVFLDDENVLGAMMSVAALGGSMLVSYIKAKGETAIAHTQSSVTKTNRMFSIGLMQYQVRMALIVVGLLFNILTAVVSITAVLTWITALTRFLDIKEELTNKD